MLSLVVITFLCATKGQAISEQDEWLKLQRSAALTPISLIIGINHQAIEDIGGEYPMIDSSLDWLMENNVNASEIADIDVSDFLIQFSTTVGIAEQLLGVNYYDYKNKNDDSIIQRMDDDNEFVIPESAQSFLLTVYPASVRDQDADVDNLPDFASTHRRRLYIEPSMMTDYNDNTPRCAQKRYGPHLIHCGSYTHYTFQLGGSYSDTRYYSCNYLDYSNCQACSQNSALYSQSGVCGNSYGFTQASCQVGVTPNAFDGNVWRWRYMGCYADTGSDRALPRLMGSGYTVEQCYQACIGNRAQVPFKYFSIQYYDYCFCSFGGSQMIKHGSANTCTYVSGNGYEGRSWSNAIYMISTCLKRFDACATGQLRIQRQAICEYPSCKPNCLQNNGGCPNNVPCHQIEDQIYRKNGMCYVAKSTCWGCLDIVNSNGGDHLERIACPDEWEAEWTNYLSFSESDPFGLDPIDIVPLDSVPSSDEWWKHVLEWKWTMSTATIVALVIVFVIWSICNLIACVNNAKKMKGGKVYGIVSSDTEAGMEEIELIKD